MLVVVMGVFFQILLPFQKISIFYKNFSLKIEKIAINILFHYFDYKSVNLQYITLGCLDNGTNQSSSKSLMFQVLVFHTFYRLRVLKTLYFYFFNFIENKKKIERSFAKNFARNLGKKIILGTSDTWSGFVCPIVQATRRNIL